MSAFTYIETDTGSNANITSATAVGAYTATGDKLIMVDVSIDQVAGNGDYVMYVTRQIGGAGSAYVILPKTTMTAASGETAISGQSGWITVRNGDVLTCYVVGLAGDTTTPDWTTRWFELGIDVNIAAIKNKTDQLTFTQPGKVDASATVDPTGIATEAHLQEVDDKVDHIKSKMDLLDVSKVNVVTPVNGSTITILRGDTFIATLTDIGNLTNYISLDFSVKRTVHEPDDNATIRIRKNVSGTDDGLLRLNGAAHAVGTDGSITIGDTTTGDITIMLNAGVTKELVSGNYVYDIQLIEADEVSTLTSGALVVSPDVTRLVA